MSAGAKLGKVFGAIGSGLSFVPGPWSALGVALTAAGGLAGKAGEKQEEEEQTQTSQPQQPQDQSRPEQQQIEPKDNAQPAVASAGNIFQPQSATQGGYQMQMDQAIANYILRGDLNDERGV